MMEVQRGGYSETVRNRKCSSCRNNQAAKLDISIPGLNRLFDRSVGKVAKIVWLVTVIFCAIVCACLTVYQLQEYFKFPTATKTIIERRQTVQFPSITVCPLFGTQCYDDELKREIKSQCQDKNITDCDIDNISFELLEINVQNVWDRCHFIAVNVDIINTDMFEEKNDTNYDIVKKHTIHGSCVTVTHTRKVTYLSLTTMLRIIILSKHGFRTLSFFPHEHPEFGTMGQEFINQEMETVLLGHRTQFKLREEVFHLENSAGRECFDRDSEREQFNKNIENSLNEYKSKICRLPLLSNDFPECDTLDHFHASFRDVLKILDPVMDKKLTAKPVCSQILYGIATDYVLPIPEESTDDARNTTTTNIVVKFADDTRVVISEYFSYSFPALVSDLFAYWGFFLCLSALVFAEIIEFLICKVYDSFKQRNKSRK